MKLPLDMEVDLGSGDMVLDGEFGTQLLQGVQPPISAHVCCGQTVGWIKMRIGRDVDLGPGDIV